MQRSIWNIVLILAGLNFVIPGARAAEPEPRGFQSRVYKDQHEVSHKYVIFVPFQYDKAKPAPVLLFLHGSGERGTNGIDQIMVGLGPALWKRRPNFPFIVIFPQCEPEITWRAGDQAADRALAMLKLTQQEFQTDPDRVYLTGLSMGGHGAWTIAAKDPEMFAAIAPMCSRAELADAPKLAAAHLPIWNFCGDQDSPQTVEFNRQMHAALTTAGAKDKYTEYPGVGHNCWDAAYGTDELYTWLLEQSRSKNRDAK